MYYVGQLIIVVVTIFVYVMHLPFFYSCRLPACFLSCLFFLYPVRQFSFPDFISISDFISETKKCVDEIMKMREGFSDCFYSCSPP